MREQEFKKWLQEKYQNSEEKKENRTVSNRISNCKNIEKYYGDLDEHMLKDNCEKIIQELTYSVEDEKKGLAPKHPIKIDGDIRTGSATLKQAVNLYVEFFKENPIENKKLNEKVTEIINNFNYDNSLNTSELQKSIIEYLKNNLKSFEWKSEYKPSNEVNDRIDIFGSSKYFKTLIIAEIDKPRADQVSKKFLSRTALFINEDIIYIALCQNGTENMSKPESEKYFKYCEIISSKLSKNSNSKKKFIGKIL